MSDTLERATALLAGIAKRGDEIERARQLPLDVLDDLVQAGCFRMLVPRGYGGDELSLPDALRVVTALSTADGATGWNVMIGCTSPLVFGFLPESTFQEIYRDGPDVVAGGTLAPKGTAVALDGGYRVTGQWPFASGCQHCAWLGVQSMVLTDGKPAFMPNGMPVMRVAVLPADEVTILDTWYVSGLRGTGSNDVRVDDAFVPTERTCTLFGSTPTIPAPIFSISPVAQLGLFIAAVAIGIAAGAVSDLAELAGAGKRPAFSAKRVAESPLFQDRLGEADGAVRAARALLLAESQQAWDKAARGEEVTLLDRARLRATGSQVTELATKAVDLAYHGGGGTSIYDHSPLQRRLRDIHALTQHAGVGRDFSATVGALLVGEPVDPMRI
jgi:alkylation response protein AidB-like acyl-CoA dehydrogenase